MPDNFLANAFLSSAQQRLGRSTEHILHCVNQLDETQLWWRPTATQNSIGNLILHLCGNVRQWIISGVGGVPDVLDRPNEFADDARATKEELLGDLQGCVKEAQDTLAEVEPSQLLSSHRIQGFDTTLLPAILDTVSHFQGHTQEIIALTRQQLGEKYEFFWTPSTAEEISARGK